MIDTEIRLYDIINKPATGLSARMSKNFSVFRAEPICPASNLLRATISSEKIMITIKSFPPRWQRLFSMQFLMPILIPECNDSPSRVARRTSAAPKSLLVYRIRRDTARHQHLSSVPNQTPNSRNWEKRGNETKQNRQTKIPGGCATSAGQLPEAIHFARFRSRCAGNFR